MFARFSRRAWLILVASLAAGAIASAQRPKLDVEYEPTPMRTVERMLDLGTVGPNDFLIDLGSGDGRIVIAAAKRGARGLGVDLDPQRVREAEANAKAAGVADKVTFRQENLFDTDLSAATVITLFLWHDINIKLRPRLLALRPGTRIVSNEHTMDKWKPDRRVSGPLHLWIVPAQVAGKWRLSTGSQEFLLELAQEFQEIKGTVKSDDRSEPLQGAQLSGAEIGFQFELNGSVRLFRGTVAGGKMEGHIDDGRAWNAVRL